MPHRRLFTLGLIIILLTACAPTASHTEPAASPRPVYPTTAPVATQPPTAVPTVVPTPTAIPIELPVDRFTGLPNLLPLTAANLPDLEAVGTFSDAVLVEAKVSSAQDRVVFAFSSGAQVFELPELTPKPFLPLELRDVGGRRIFQISPDARYVSMISKERGDQVIIWNLETQSKTCTLQFDGAVSAGGNGPLIMQFFPETNLFLFNGRWGERNSPNTNEVRLIDLDNCQAIFEFQPLIWPVMAVSPDGRFLVQIKDDQAYLFKTQDKSETPVGAAGNLRGVGFTADSKAVIVSNSYLTKMYDLATGEVLSQMEASLGRNTVYLYPLQDGHRILIAGENSNRIWDFTGNTNYSPGAEHISMYRDLFDDHNGVIVTWEAVWNLDTKNRVSLTKYPNGRWSSAFSREGRYMAVESGYAPWQTDLFDLTTGQVLTRLAGERGPVALGGELFITSGQGQSFIHRFDTGELLNTLTFPYVSGISTGVSQTVVWDTQGNVYLLDAKTGEILRQSTLPVIPLMYQAPDYYLTQHAFPVREQSLGGYDPTALVTGIGRDTVLLSPNGQTAIQMSGDNVQIFRVETGMFHPTPENLLASYAFKDVWFEFAFSPDSSLVAGKTYSQLLVWDTQTGKQVRAFIGDEYLKSQFLNLGFSPNSQLFLLDSLQEEDRVLVILDIQTGKLVRTHSVAACPVSIPFVFTPDGSGVFTVSPDCRIGLYTLTDWQLVREFGEPIFGAKLALALSPDGKFLAVGSKSTLEIFEAQSGRRLKRVTGLDTGITDFIGDFKLTFSPEGNFLAARYGYSVFTDTTVTLFGVPEP